MTPSEVLEKFKTVDGHAEPGVLNQFRSIIYHMLILVYRGIPQ